MSFSNATGSGATATVTLGTGSVTSLGMSAAGSGYTGATTASFTYTGGSTTSAATASVTLSSLILNGTANTVGGTGGLQINAAISNGTSAGGFSKVGSGTLILTGANTYSGPTVVAAGVLQLGNGTAGNDGTIAGSSIVDNSSVIFDPSGSPTYGGVISGTGGVVLTGTGTQILSGANTYSGSTTVYRGTLVLSGSTSSAGVVTVGAGGTLSGAGSAGNVTVNAGGAINLQDGTIDSMNLNSLTLGGGLASSLMFDIQNSGTTTSVDSLNIGGNLTLNPFTVVDIANLSGTSTLTDTTDTLVAVSGSLTGYSLTGTNYMSDLTVRGTAESDGQDLAVVQQGNNIDLQVTSTVTPTTNTVTLDGYEGQHPKLFFSTGTGAGSVSALQATITASGTVTGTSTPRWGELWSSFLNYAGATAVQPPPKDTDTVSALNEELWERPVGDAASIVAMAAVMTETSTLPSTDTITFEAEDAPYHAPMTVGSDPNASCDKYLSTPTGTSNSTSTLQPPSASYYFSSQSLQPYYIWSRVNVPSGTGKWFLNIDGPTGNATQTYYNSNPVNYFNASTSTTGSWTWVESGPIYMTPGNHVLNLTYESGGVEFDKFAISTSTVTPSNFGAEQHWLEARNFQLNANGTGTQTYNLLVTSTDAFAVKGDEVSATQQWLETYSGNTGESTQPASTATPDAQQSFITNGGSYDIWVRMKAPYKGHADFWFAYDTNTYTSVTMETSSVTFPYNPLIPVTNLSYNSTLSAPYNSYPYREWVWVKAKSNVNLGTGQTSHTLKAINENTDGSAALGIDRFLVWPTSTLTPTDPNKFLGAAYDYATAGCSYPYWGIGSSDGTSLAAASMLKGLSYLYDWCYSDLSSTDQTAIYNRLYTQGGLMNSGASTMWWRNSALDNIYIECCSSLNTVGVALYGDSGTTTFAWTQTAQNKLNNTINDLPSDGAWQEGPGYYSYALTYLLEYLDESNKLLGVNRFNTPWLENTASYRLFFDLPANQQSAYLTHIPFSDSVGYEWYGPDYLLRKLASLYNIPTAQWQAEHYNAAGLTSWSQAGTQTGTAPWLNFFWYNPSVAEIAPSVAGPGGGSIPTLGYFGDLDFAVSRTDWSGNESVVAFQCGPPIGHGVQDKDKPFVNDWGSNHVHPAVNSFCLFSDSNWLLQDSGDVDAYGVANNKLTYQENTLEIDSPGPMSKEWYGQLGESIPASITFSPTNTSNEDPNGTFNPAIDDNLSYSSTLMDYMVGDASTCYQPADGLTKFRRHLLHLKDGNNTLVVVDDVVLNSAMPLILNFYPQNVASGTITPGISYSTTSSNGAVLDFTLLSPTTTSTLTNVTRTWTDTNTLTTTHNSYQVMPVGGSSSNWSNAVALTWGTSTVTPASVTMITDPDNTAWKFKVGTVTMVLDRNVTSFAPDEDARAVTTLEAESGSLTLPMQVYTDSTGGASNSAYISTPIGTTPNLPTDTLSGPSATYTFTPPDTATYAIWARVQAANYSSNSFWYALNPSGGPYSNLVSAPVSGGWIWVNLTKSATLTGGVNATLGIKYAAPNCWIDQIIVTEDPLYTPTYKY